MADEVRAAQARLGFGDGAAHRMALLAMDQLAWAVAGLRAGFEVGDTEDALRASLAHGRVAVWAPYSLVAGRSDIPQSWTVTSDSLALWLARRLGAECCYVIKSIERRRAAVQRRGSSPATAWSTRPFPPCSRTQASTSSCSAAAISRPSRHALSDRASPCGANHRLTPMR